jgi:hypothetical protein
MQALAEARAAELAGQAVNNAEHSEQAVAAAASAHSTSANENAADSTAVLTAAAAPSQHTVAAAAAAAAVGASSLAELNMLSADALRAALDAAGLPHQFCLDRGELAFLLHTVQRHGATATAAAHARLSARRASAGAVASSSSSINRSGTLRSSSSTGALRPRQPIAPATTAAAASWLFGSTGNWSSSSSETSSSSSSSTSRSPVRRLQSYPAAAATHARSAAWIEEIHRSSQSASVIETALNEVRQERHRSLLRRGVNSGHEILNWRSLQGH